MIRSQISLAPKILIRTASQIRAAPVPLWCPREPLQTYLMSIMMRLAGLALFWSRTDHSCACLFLKSFTPSMSSHSAIRPTVQRIRNALELVPPQPVRRNHIRVRKGLGQVHHSPKKKTKPGSSHCRRNVSTQVRQTQSPPRKVQPAERELLRRY
jgi:hypothetical protein